MRCNWDFGSAEKLRIWIWTLDLRMLREAEEELACAGQRVGRGKIFLVLDTPLDFLVLTDGCLPSAPTSTPQLLTSALRIASHLFPVHTPR